MRRYTCCAFALALVVGNVGWAEVRRERPEERPYIVEIGDPYAISLHAVRRQAGRISEMAEYLGQYGEPDYAEIQEVQPDWPWESYEVRLYYLRRE